ncbi:MAG: histidine kinase, partial [Hymenobacteraceae bacterium]|nr:histidine kinase [Hymenobacteraceae bacterium]
MLLLLLLLVAWPAYAQVQAPDTVQLQATGQEIQAPLQVFHDRTGRRSLAEVQQQPFSCLDSMATMQAGKTVHWVRVVLQNATRQEQTRYLYAGDWSRLHLFAQHADGYHEERQTGQLLPVQERDVPQNKPYVRVQVVPQSHITLYLRLQGDIN